MKFAIHTLGCKVNQFDEERMRRQLIAAGLEETDFETPSDLFIINTCTVTHVADKKSRQMIRRAMRTNPHARIVATGCAVSHKRGIATEPRILRIPNKQKHRLLELLGHELPDHHEQPPVAQARTRALLRVQDGCDQFCTFCIVPFVRGRSRSTPPEEVMGQALELVTGGYREIVLTGVQLGGYGKAEGYTLGQLLDRLAERFPETRFRLSSIEPGEFTPDIFDAMARHPNICHHLHLALQHASDPVLERMRRGYTRADYDVLARRFLSEFPDGALTADILVGFPGETADDFQTLLDYLQATPFYRLHVFPHSHRPGTAAVRLPDQVPEALKRERSDAVLALNRLQVAGFEQRAVGRVVECIVEESTEPTAMTGNYLTVHLDRVAPVGTRLQVRITERRNDRLYGCIEDMLLASGIECGFYGEAR
ncbi:MAG: tRNA (N(6)-L-threonylcarbamoyladenosine(37)-C(2))-methylthiotransferase MtaB [Candidatus Xenobia bacterium]